MLLNVSVLGVVFFILCILSLAGWVNSYDSEGSRSQVFFMVVMLTSLLGVCACFLAAVFLFIMGG